MIIYVVCGIFYYDTTPFVCLLDGKVCVPAKGVETLDFLFRAVRVFGSTASMEREVLVRVMYCSSVRLENTVGSHLSERIRTGGYARKGLGNNLARKCLAGMPQFLYPANFIFRSSTRLVRYYSNFQNFYVVPYIHFLPLVELECWLAEMRSFPHQHRRQHSSAQDTSGQGYSRYPSLHGQKGMGFRLG